MSAKAKHEKANAAFGKGDFGSIASAMRRILLRTWIIAIGIR